MAPLVKPTLLAIWLLTCLGMALTVQARLAHRSAGLHPPALQDR
jgi:hypothetical protein